MLTLFRFRYHKGGFGSTMPRIIIFCLSLLMLSEVRSKLTKVQVIRSRGSFKSSEGKLYETIFLSKPNLEVVSESEAEAEQKSFLLTDIVPLILPADTLSEEVLRAQKWSVDQLINMDDGVFDGLPYQWSDNVLEKRDLRSKLLTFRPAAKENAYQTLQSCLFDRWQSKICALYLEVEDALSSSALSLGGTVVLSREAEASPWDSMRLSRELKVSSNSRQASDATTHLCSCSQAELVAASLCLSLPIFMDSDLYDSCSVDARISQIGDGTLIEAKAPPMKGRKSVDDDNLPLAWEIYNPSDFFRLSTLEKRAILRKSGVKALPRPRLGQRALDEVFLDLMDDAVRGEVRRLQAMDSQRASLAYESERQRLLEQMGSLLLDGKEEDAIRLREQFVQLTALRADPTQTVGSYDPYLDQDEWYLEARRRAMGKKK